MQGKSFDSMIGKLTGQEPKNNGNGRSYMTTPLGQQANLKGRQMLLEGMLAFVSKESLDKLEALLGTRPSKRFMRKLIEDIANGTLKVVTGDQPLTNNNGHAAEPVYTLQQAAKVLGCRPSMLYFRARKNRIQTTLDGHRYLIGQAEINRLSRVGL
jgi:hypothetical protein